MESDALTAYEDEVRLLTMVVSDRSQFPRIASRVTSEHFGSPDLRAAWEAAQAVFEKQGTLSLVGLEKEIRDRNLQHVWDVLLEWMGNSWILDELEPTLTALNVALTRRRMFEAGRKIAQAAQDPNQEDVVGLEVTAQGILYNAIQHAGKRDVVRLEDAAAKAVEELGDAREGKPSLRIGTGFTETLDRRLGGGMAPGDLIIVAGRTGTGKTALAEKIAIHAAQKHGSVLYFSPEMSGEALANRALQMMGPIRTEEMRVPDDGTMERAGKALKTIKGLPFYIADQRQVSVEDVVTMSQAFRLEHPDMSLLVIDHFGELSIPYGGDRNLPRTLGIMASRLRQLASDLDVPVLLLNQINRGVESKNDKRPKKSDLRDSGRLEEIADIILLLYREQDLPEDLEHLAELIVDKNRRTGWTNTLIIEFQDDFVRYQDATREMRQAYIQTILQRARAS